LFDKTFSIPHAFLNVQFHLWEDFTLNISMRKRQISFTRGKGDMVYEFRKYEMNFQQFPD
jgi:hypothetical protein